MKTEPTRRLKTLFKALWTTFFLFYTGLVFYMSIRPLGEGTPVIGIPGMDKLAHAGEFALFVLIGLPTVERYEKVERAGVFVAVIAILYGSITEFSQLFIAYRTASGLDWLANVVGTGIGLLIVFKFRYRKNKRQ
ncbi:MAG: VanZ family protein [Candidatus Acetothermia bacterium]